MEKKFFRFFCEHFEAKLLELWVFRKNLEKFVLNVPHSKKFGKNFFFIFFQTSLFTKMGIQGTLFERGGGRGSLLLKWKKFFVSNLPQSSTIRCISSRTFQIWSFYPMGSNRDGEKRKKLPKNSKKMIPWISISVKLIPYPPLSK